MSYVEIKKIINAPAKSINHVLIDPSLAVKWNLTLEEIEQLGPNKYCVNSTLGELTINRAEEVEKEKLSYDIEGNIFNSISYIISPRGDLTEVSLWVKFEEKKNKKILLKAGEVLLNSLKRFIEHLEDGGDIDEFDKKVILVQPLT